MKKILFLTGTRADFGKLKSLMLKIENSDQFEAYVFVTGMHLLKKYGFTGKEVEKCGFENTHNFFNQNRSDSMDSVLAKTISGLSDYAREIEPDMIVIHGDRVEALAGAIVGSLNNILVSHIEGGEVSGTIDELIRHAVTKMSHLHFVSNERAGSRLIQLGELESTIFNIGSPDLDIMVSDELPSLDKARNRYDIPFEEYAVFMYHPVTTEIDKIREHIKETVDALLSSTYNYIVVYPNNDSGSDIIIDELDRLNGHDRFRVFPSLRFEYFLTLLKNSQFMIGNSSAGVREVPFYGIPSINLGSRQNNRATAKSIVNCPERRDIILETIQVIEGKTYDKHEEFGCGNSDTKFYDILSSSDIWNTSKQKLFSDISIEKE
ncbi:UDP-N-acetylglucosamine 2-epimerase (hydrolyzing) [Vibrio sp. D404a]|nr:UDP-N-acetylglucosamine 2-epimerase (hydrolyzing) [Vibrio sp. D404a]MDK9795312.1 UDP-N-acetylglucosamine 2-epimerase (hydrolyzing) [Vibrio sp. D449a]